MSLCYIFLLKCFYGAHVLIGKDKIIFMEPLLWLLTKMIFLEPLLWLLTEIIFMEPLEWLAAEMIFTNHWPLVSWKQRYFPGAGCLSWFFLFAENDFWQAGDQVLLGKLHTKNLQCGQTVSRLPVCKNHQQFIKPRYNTAKEMCLDGLQSLASVPNK